MEIQFYDVKTREKVAVPEANVRKTRYERTTKNGRTSTRYALRGTYEGRKLTTFVSREDWERLDVPEE
jgi:hypothetical protein